MIDKYFWIIKNAKYFQKSLELLICVVFNISFNNHFILFVLHGVMFIRTFLLFLSDVPKSKVLMDDYIMKYNNVQNLDLRWKVPRVGS